ncbi:NAD(P)-dependent alcohol dehydrogenase [Wenzhouxiangella marina]|uniref:NADPH:quinone reductase n=1 Tax=Wenzhouxiangella marina TaxID=1579979 RepID=A0A0K0XUA5_9GAMM|nr:NAD(P)-dependent alcohol dehydrogenase [Wenzhouxiangella marina]AKS41268.1 NADPH:quinone reductase [Wenzhouxiangella marina]MBB6086982.1 NADPH:quinone reductase-like Zn-dependent oxidoreductase [Wenzhouxiangella marina]
MKAVAWRRYGSPTDALAIIEAETPAPKEDELLIRVCASAVTSGDSRIRALRVPVGFGLLSRLGFGLLKPRTQIPGMSFAGEVAAVGGAVSSFRVGDQVYGSAGMRMGAHAEYLCLAESAAVIKAPDGVDAATAAAAVFGGQTAIHFLKATAGLEGGQRILINGASGSVGSASVQLAKHLGAEVVAVCSTGNVELVRSLGADRVIDYRTERIEDDAGGFDFVLDTVGNLSLSRCKPLLKADGKLIAIVAGLLTTLSSTWRSRLICGVAVESKAHLDTLATLLEGGQFKPVIDEVYPLDRIVEAHERVDGCHKRGEVVVGIGECRDWPG